MRGQPQVEQLHTPQGVPGLSDAAFCVPTVCQRSAQASLFLSLYVKMLYWFPRAAGTNAHPRGD